MRCGFLKMRGGVLRMRSPSNRMLILGLIQSCCISTRFALVWSVAWRCVRVFKNQQTNHLLWRPQAPHLPLFSV